MNAGLFLSQLRKVHGTFLTTLSNIWHAYFMLTFKLRGSVLCSFFFHPALLSIMPDKISYWAVIFKFTASGFLFGRVSK